MADAETRTATLNITECTLGYTGSNDKGEFQIFDIKALDSKGNPVAAKLKAFGPVPLGSAQYEMEKYTSKKGDVSWTLKVNRSNSGGGVSYEDFTNLSNRVTAVEQRLGLTDSDVTPADDDNDDFLGQSGDLEDDDIPF